MKNTIYFLGILTLFLMFGCQKLDRDIITTLDEKTVNTNYGYTMDRAMALYTDLPNGFFEIDGAMMASTCDEAEHTLETSGVQLFNAGSWNAYQNPDNVWAKYFSHSVFINKLL